MKQPESRTLVLVALALLVISGGAIVAAPAAVAHPEYRPCGTHNWDGRTYVEKFQSDVETIGCFMDG